MPDLTPERLAELERLAKAATPGEWFYVEQSHGGCGLNRNEKRVYAVEICGDGRGPDCRPWFEGCGFKRWSSRVIAKMQDWCQWTDHPANRDLIIALRNSASDLIEAAKENARLKEEISQLKEAISPGSIGTLAYYIGVAKRMRMKETVIRQAWLEAKHDE